jgi:sugar lactone lactonase YvrE
MSSGIQVVEADTVLELGEGARLIDGVLLFVDLLRGSLFRMDPREPDLHAELVFRAHEPLGAVAAVDAHPGFLVAAIGTSFAVLRPRATIAGAVPVTRWERPSRPPATSAVYRVNDAVADPCGRFWWTTMRYDTKPDSGALLCIDTDGRTRTARSALTIPNGPAFSDRGDVMYLADSARGIIWRHEVDIDTAELGPGEVFSTVSDGSPDGMTLDSAGGLWSAVWGAARVDRYRPDGHLDFSIELPARQPTSVCLFDRAGLPSLAITTAAIGLSDQGDADGHVLIVPVSHHGRPADLAAARVLSFQPVPDG